MNVFLVRIRDFAIQPDDSFPKFATFLFRSSRSLKQFPPSPQPLTSTNFRLQPPRLLFLVDDPKTVGQASLPVCFAPSTHSPPKASPPPVPIPQTARSQVIRRRTPFRKPKPISNNPNRLNKELGSFLHFARSRTPVPEPMPAALVGLALPPPLPTNPPHVV